MITTPAIKQEIDMVRGGKREGAGAPRKEPTAQVRVPKVTQSGARQIAEVALFVARECMRTRHPGVTLEVEVLGVKNRRAWRSGGAHTEINYDGPMIWASATDGEIREEFYVSWDGLFYADGRI